MVKDVDGQGIYTQIHNDRYRQLPSIISAEDSLIYGNYYRNYTLYCLPAKFLPGKLNNLSFKISFYVNKLHLKIFTLDEGVIERHSNITIKVQARDSSAVNITTGGDIVFLTVSKYLKLFYHKS